MHNNWSQVNHEKLNFALSVFRPCRQDTWISSNSGFINWFVIWKDDVPFSCLKNYNEIYAASKNMILNSSTIIARVNAPSTSTEVVISFPKVNFTAAYIAWNNIDCFQWKINSWSCWIGLMNNLYRNLLLILIERKPINHLLFTKIIFSLSLRGLEAFNSTFYATNSLKIAYCYKPKFNQRKTRILLKDSL